MKIAILTSSRADYSIYYPLLKALKEDSFFELSIIAFGTHLSNNHGNTSNQIISDGFDIAINVDTIPDDDSPAAISRSIGKAISNFSAIWKENNFDFIFCLGDRFEMFAACASTIPFNLKLVHIHGGEQTLGAIDDVFRHAITHMSTCHFTTTNQYFERVIQIKGSPENVFNVGSLSIDNLISLNLLSIEEFKERFEIDLSFPSILITFHPETISFEKNENYINELLSTLNVLNEFQLIFTMPNSDTMGNLIRKKILRFIKENKKSKGVESFGTLGYLSCMKHCSFMMGNTSSGFVEASFFPKYVINLGDRQKGRILTSNIFQVEINKTQILCAIEKIISKNFEAPKIDIYGNGNTASKIVSILKSDFSKEGIENLILNF